MLVARYSIVRDQAGGDRFGRGSGTKKAALAAAEVAHNGARTVISRFFALTSFRLASGLAKG